MIVKTVIVITVIVITMIIKLMEVNVRPSFFDHINQTTTIAVDLLRSNLYNMEISYIIIKKVEINWIEIGKTKYFFGRIIISFADHLYVWEKKDLHLDSMFTKQLSWSIFDINDGKCCIISINKICINRNVLKELFK